MYYRTRTFKALAALAGSMTAATAFLSWLEPKPRPQLAAASPAVLAESVRNAISTAGSLDPTTWRGLEIVPTRETGDWRGRALTAMAPASDHHFQITETGQVKASPAWQAQRFDPSAGIVRIMVYAPTGSSDPAGASYETLKALLIELRSLAGSHDHPIKLPPDTPESAPLRDMLAREGFLG